jgi:hypothetical protein
MPRSPDWELTQANRSNNKDPEKAEPTIASFGALSKPFNKMATSVRRVLVCIRPQNRKRPSSSGFLSCRGAKNRIWESDFHGKEKCDHFNRSLDITVEEEMQDD